MIIGKHMKNHTFPLILCQSLFGILMDLSDSDKIELIFWEQRVLRILIVITISLMKAIQKFLLP